MKKWLRLLLLLLFIGLLYFTLTDKLEPDTSNKADTTNNKADTTNNKTDTTNTPSNEEKYKVVIDPGHGGEDPGAIGASGYEKDFTLSLAKKISILLQDEPKLEVHMTREEDVFLSAETRERTNYANNIDADVFISLHANTFTDPSVSGTESFYYHKNSKRLANIIHRHVSETTGFRNRGVKKENFFVLKDTTMPAVLLEIGYITNPEDEQKMLTDDFQQSVAESIKSGIKEFLID
ncbi:N-acetylmuramoyl-L-alanine amidase family protein [Gracilibacillus alcaliphilus]|uniref:N-acetylmuramoyl-L-alanine amidase family protein n=1 Tax=Gracilibacillus alcaliphilus TaxID=1401441 RepID=UPI00195AF2FA|nr:N-acetylmuramoyl-L-alanine amidase [Gracilibacillus alcaliphilus]MBM7679814.1 N-acetylmuramoyl-L-alanine amidase [Gracilibacillus alcaliphilus]